MERAEEQGAVVSISCSSDQKRKANIKSTEIEKSHKTVALWHLLSFKMRFLTYDFLVVPL